MFYQRSVQRALPQSAVMLSLLALFVLVLAGCAQMPPAQPATGANAQSTPAVMETPTEAASSAMTTTASSAMTTTASSAMTTTTSTSAAGGAVVMVADNATLGKILVDAKGMTLYLFDKDEKDKSNCSGNCLTNWPPLTVKDEKEVMAGEGITGTLATITRDDGSYQVTVNGMPVYYYAKDMAAGDVVGQGVGDVWWVLGPDGNKITKK